MKDVKMVTGHAMNVWYLSMIGLILFGVWAKFGYWWEEYKQGLRRGGWLTIFLIVAIILSVFLSFGVIFVGFHNIFFESGTWTFQFSDTLIRLFPERFWRDTFLAVGLIALAGGLKSMLFGGEGIFLATLSGTGTVLLQSLPFSRMADRILQNAPSSGGKRTGEGSILGALGDMIDGD